MSISDKDLVAYSISGQVVTKDYSETLVSSLYSIVGLKDTNEYLITSDKNLLFYSTNSAIKLSKQYVLSSIIQFYWADQMETSKFIVTTNKSSTSVYHIRSWSPSAPDNNSTFLSERSFGSGFDISIVLGLQDS